MNRFGLDFVDKNSEDKRKRWLVRLQKVIYWSGLATIVMVVLLAAGAFVGHLAEIGLLTPAEKLTFVIIPAEEPELSKEQFAPLVDYLSGQLEMDIELMVVADYTAVVEAMKYGHADIARFGPFSYVLAVEEAQVEAVAAAIKAKTGMPDYRALIVARADSGVTSLDNCTFAYVDPASTSGYLVPYAYIASENIELGEVFYAGSHSAVIEAVRNGAVDAGAIADNRFYVARDEGVIEAGEFVVLWESEPIPNSPVAVRQDLDIRLKDQIRVAFINAPTELVQALGIGETGYVAITDADYDVVREVQAATEQ